MKKERVAVLGASPNRDRYANKAVRELVQHGHEVIPVNPGHQQIEGLDTVAGLAGIKGSVDTLTVYVGPERIKALLPEIVNLQPKRVIINPGAESADLTKCLQENGIAYEEACTLVMLRTGQF